MDYGSFMQTSFGKESFTQEGLISDYLEETYRSLWIEFSKSGASQDRHLHISKTFSRSYDRKMNYCEFLSYSDSYSNFPEHKSLITVYNKYFQPFILEISCSDLTLKFDFSVY